MKRDAIIADPKAGAKYLAGDAATAAEIRALNKTIAAGDVTSERVENALSGSVQRGLIENTTGEEFTSGQMVREVARLRTAGLSDQAIRDVVNGTPISAEQHRAFEIFKSRCLADRGWVARYRNGDAEAKTDFAWFSAGVIAPVIGVK